MENEKQKEQSLNLKITDSDANPPLESIADVLEFETEKGTERSESSESSNSSDRSYATSAISNHSEPPTYVSAANRLPEITPSETARHAEADRVIKLNQRRRARESLSNYSADVVTMGCVGLILFVFFSMMTYSTIWSYPWQYNWGHAKGQVTSPWQGLKSHVTYTYRVGDDLFSGKEFFQIHGLFLFPKQSVDIRYDPESPTSSVIETGPTVATLCWLVAALVSLCLVLAPIQGYLKKINDPEETTVPKM